MNTGDKIKHALEFSLIITLLIFGTLGVVFSVKAYPQTFATEIKFQDGERKVALEEGLVFDFSEPMIKEAVESGIKIIPETKLSYQWTDANRRLSIFPETSWRPETEYAVEIKKARNIMMIETTAAFSFATITYPQVKTFTPRKGETDVLIGIEDPISISFDRTLENYQVKISIEPNEGLSYQMDEEKNQLELLPKNLFEEGRAYLIDVYIKHKNETEDEYRKIHQTSFVTKSFPQDPKERSVAERLLWARKKTAPKVETGKYIDINLQDQVMVIFEDGKSVESFLVSSGKKGMDTPRGNFKIHNKAPKPWSKKYSLFMPNWMALMADGKYGIHELPEWPGGYKEGANHLGIPVSHGCVRLGIGSAKRVYDWAEIGTPVVIY